MVLRGEAPPVRLAARAMPTVAETAWLSREDVASATRLEQAFQRMGYRLEDVGSGLMEAPPLFLTQIPSDMDELEDPAARKALFLRVMLPLVLAVDEEIANDRAELLSLSQRRAAGHSLNAKETAWLAALAKRYDSEPDDFKTLLSRVDVVPPSLALAQSAEESGWGTSQLARGSQNLFGHTVDIPGEDVGMRNFASLYEGVRAYVHNLNTHRAYESLRRARAQSRAKGVAPDGHALVAALHGYSERGEAYVSSIRALIRRNDLIRFDRARLGRALPGRMASAG